jgi:hypothetical protein
MVAVAAICAPELDSGVVALNGCGSASGKRTWREIPRTLEFVSRSFVAPSPYVTHVIFKPHLIDSTSPSLLPSFMSLQLPSVPSIPLPPASLFVDMLYS